MIFNKKLYFICFAGGDKKYFDAQNRLLNQIRGLKLFDEIIGFTPADLDIDYFEKFKDIIKMYPKGFGLWSWKPWIIKKVLEKMSEGDLLFYLDVGFELNSNGKVILFDFLNKVRMMKLLAFGNSTKHTDYTKPVSRLIKPSDGDSQQISAAFIALEKCDYTNEIVSNWLNLCAEGNGELLNESYLVGNEVLIHPLHRHDQAVLTRILLDASYNAISPDPTFSTDWKSLKHSPFLNFRNYSNRSVVKFELLEGWKGVILVIIRHILLVIKFRKIEEKLKVYFHHLLSK
jgi:hypothetical protein